MEGISRVTIVITDIRGLITPLITTHEPPSKAHRSVPRVPIPKAMRRFRV